MRLQPLHHLITIQLSLVPRHTMTTTPPLHHVITIQLYATAPHTKQRDTHVWCTRETQTFGAQEDGAKEDGLQEDALLRLAPQEHLCLLYLLGV